MWMNLTYVFWAKRKLSQEYIHIIPFYLYEIWKHIKIINAVRVMIMVTWGEIMPIREQEVGIWDADIFFLISVVIIQRCSRKTQMLNSVWGRDAWVRVCWAFPSSKETALLPPAPSPLAPSLSIPSTQVIAPFPLPSPGCRHSVLSPTLQSVEWAPGRSGSTLAICEALWLQCPNILSSPVPASTVILAGQHPQGFGDWTSITAKML
jgi:hypothetical protein